MSSDVYAPFTDPEWKVRVLTDALKQIHAAHFPWNNGAETRCRHCGYVWPCADYQIADQALVDTDLPPARKER